MRTDLDNKRILIIDDSEELCEGIRTMFEQAGAIVCAAHVGKEGLKDFFHHKPDLVILDIMLPDISGWEVCRQIRLLAATPILILSCLGEDDEVIRGLELGADDYVSKPFSMDVLLARSCALLRRASDAAPARQSAIFSDGHLTIDLRRRRVLVEGKPVKLTATEFELLSYLVRNAGHVVSYDQILEQVWGPQYRNSPDYVHVYLSHLRQKLEPNPRRPRYLLTEHGVGYRFENELDYL